MTLITSINVFLHIEMAVPSSLRAGGRGSVCLKLLSYTDTLVLCYSIKTYDKPLIGASAGSAFPVLPLMAAAYSIAQIQAGTILCTRNVLIRTFREVCTPQIDCGSSQPFVLFQIVFFFIIFFFSVVISPAESPSYLV